MLNTVFPLLAGLGWNVRRAPTWSTKIQRDAAGSERRIAYADMPLWRWTLSYEFLRQTGPVYTGADLTARELERVAGFYNATMGRFHAFRFEDPDDHALTEQGFFGTGTGAQVTFRLARSFGNMVGSGGILEPVPYVGPASPIIYVNGVLQVQPTDCIVGSDGVVTFTSAPAGGTTLTWTGNYQWWVRFDQDEMEFAKFLAGFWEGKSLTLVQVRGGSSG